MKEYNFPLPAGPCKSWAAATSRWGDPPKQGREAWLAEACCRRPRGCPVVSPGSSHSTAAQGRAATAGVPLHQLAKQFFSCSAGSFWKRFWTQPCWCQWYSSRAAPDAFNRKGAKVQHLYTIATFIILPSLIFNFLHPLVVAHSTLPPSRYFSLPPDLLLLLPSKWKCNPNLFQITRSLILLSNFT